MVIIFSRKSNITYTKYNLNNRVTVVRDLGIFIDSKLIFKSYITHIAGFILRTSKDFKKIKVLILL